MRVGDLHVGVRTDDAEVLARIERAYEAHRVTDPNAVDDLSLVFHPPSVDGTRRRPSLRHGGCDVVRSATSDRLLRALDCFLVDASASHEGLVRVTGMGAIVRGDRASIVPTPLLERSSGVERRIVERSAALADATTVWFDPSRGDVVIRAGLVGDGPLGVTDPVVVPPGRYKLQRIHWLGAEVDADERPSVGVVRLLNRIVGPAAVLERCFFSVLAQADRLSSVVIGDRGVSDLDLVLDEL